MIDLLSAEEVAALGDEAFDAQVEAMVRLKGELDRAWLVMVRAMDERRSYVRHGHRNVASYVASLTGCRAGGAARDAHLADDLSENPIFEEAFTTGTVSKDKAAELVKGSKLPAPVQHKLVTKAQTLSPERLADEVKRAKVENGVDEPARPSEALISRNGDGGTLEAHLDNEETEIADVAIHSAIERLGLSKDIPIAERRAIALVSIFRYFLEHVDDPSMTRVGRPHILAVVGVETLTSETGGIGRLQSGAVIDGHTARRLACDAGISRVITRGKSEVLDVGRATREPTVAMSKAVIVRDQHCTEAGCHAPPWACEIHHDQHWGRGGHTNLSNLRLVCWYHHKRHHADHSGDASSWRKSA